MSLKTIGISVVIGAAFSGAGAFLSSQKAVDKLGGAIKKLQERRTKIEIDGGDITKIDAQIGSLTTKMEKLGNIQGKIDANLQNRENLKRQMFDKLALGATIAAPIKAAIDFESSMADVKKVVDFTDEIDFKNFSGGLLELSRTIPLSANELAQITASGGQLGIAKENLMGFTTTVAKMSTAFDMAAGEAGESIVRSFSSFSIVFV